MTGRSLRSLVLGAAALGAIISGADIAAHAEILAGQSRSSHRLTARALEPGFTGAFLYRNDNFRTGQNLGESVLTPSTVSNVALFGLVFTDPIDAAAYAQPLYVPNVAIPNLGTHNVVYVATENDSVYAFDADQPGPPLWQTSFIDPVHGITPVPASDLGCGDLVPIIGITATPVIDPANGTLYASTATTTAAATDTPVPIASPSPVFATLNANPTSIAFSSQVVGHQGKSAKVTVINTAATAQVTLSPPTASNGFIVTSSNCPAVMPPGSSCAIGVAFAPTAKGKQNGQLQLISNAKYGVRAIKLKGKGLAPKMRTKPKLLSFEQTSADAVSSPQTITIVNDSPAPISLTTAPAATPPFNVTANTCTTIAPNGGTCTISVEFAPHKHGKYQGTLEIHDNAANSPQHIKLFGSSK